jgi:hypothetical protein
MAQIIKQRRGSLEKLSQITGSLQKGEIVIATGSAQLSGVTNGQSIVFAAYESGAVSPVNRVFRGTGVPPIFSASVYNGLMNGVPYYASASNTLYLLGSDNNEAIDLSGNVITLSGSIATDFSASNAAQKTLSASVASVTGDFSSSVATSFSASAYNLNALSASINTDIYGFSGLSASVANSINQSTSASKYDNTILSASLSTADSASNAARTALSASVATTISASAATAASDNYNLSSSVATTISNLSSSIATTDSASKATQNEFSGAVATTISNLSSSIATTDSASAASLSALSASTFTNSGSVASRLNTIETTYATTGSNTFSGSQVVSGSMWITGDVTIYGSSSLVNVTASAVSIGTNTVILNTANPGVRFGGITVVDSGSNAGLSGSLFWDSENSVWLYQNPNGAGYTSARLISGPQNTGSLGQETGLTTTYVPVAVGDDHIGDSNITVVGNDVSITAGGNLFVDGEISSSTINGIGNVTDFSSSVSASLAAINNNLGNGGELGTRVANLETISASYLAFTQSYYSDSSSFDTRINSSSFDINALSASTAMVANDFSSSVATDFNNASSSAWNTFAKLAGGNTFTETQTFSNDVNVNGTTNFNNAVAVNDSNMNLGNSSALNLTNGASIYVDASGTISGSITGIGNVSEFSTSVDSRLSSSLFTINDLSASIGGGGTGIGQRVANLEALTGSYATTGSNTFQDNQTINGTLYVNNINGNNSGYVNIYSTDYAQLNYDNYSYVWVDSNGVHLEVDGSTVSVDSNGNVVLGSYTIPNTSGNANQVLVNNGSGTLTWTDLADSASIASQFSASAYNVTSLSASVASVTGDFSSSVATSFSASAASVTALSASIATTDSASAANVASLSSSVSGTIASLSSSLSSSIATSFSASLASQTTLSSSVATSFSASLANVNAVSNSIVTDFSASQHTQDVRLDSIESYTSSLQNAINVTGSGSASTTTILGNLKVQGTTTTIDSTTVAIGDNIIALNGTQGAYGGIQVADPTNPSKVSGSLLWDTTNDVWIAGPIGSEVQLADINYVSTSVASLSQSAATSFSASNYTISQLSASVASVTGDFSSSVATSFSASAFVTSQLSSSFSASQATQDGRLTVLEGTGTIQGVGTTDDVTFNSVTASVNLGNAAGNSKRIAFRNTNGALDLVPTASVAGDLLQWDGTDFVMSNTIDGGSF